MLQGRLELSRIIGREGRMELDEGVWGVMAEMGLGMRIFWCCELLPMRVPLGCFTRHLSNEGTWAKDK